MAKKLTGAEIDRLFGDDDSGQSAAPAATPAAPLTGAQINDAFGDAATPATTAAPSNPPPGGWGDTISNALDYGRGLLGSFQHGLTFGLDRPALNWLAEHPLGGTATGQAMTANAEQQKAFEAQHPIASTLAETAGTIPGYVATEGELAALPLLRPTARPGMVGAGINLAQSATRNAVVNSTISAGLADGDLNDRIAAARQGAIIGGIAGPVGDIAGRAVSGPIRAVTGGAGGASAADAQLGQLALNKYNIPIAAPDLSNNPLYRIGNDQLSHLPLSGAAGAAEKKLDAWHTAVSHEMGADAKAFTPDVMSGVRDRTGQVFDDVAKRTMVTIPNVQTMTNRLAHIETQIDGLPVSEADKKTLRWNIENINNTAAKGGGMISGADYQALTRTKGVLDRLEGAADPSTSHMGGEIRDALDDAFDASASKADQAALREARYQWRVMKTVEPLAAKSRDGRITPLGFANQVATASRRFDPGTGGMAYTGGGNIGELSKIGQLMRPAQNTGSGDRALVNLLATGGTMGGVAALTDPLTSLSVPGGLLLNNLGQRYLNSSFLANRVVNSSLNPQEAARYAPYVVPMANALASGKVPIQ